MTPLVFPGFGEPGLPLDVVWDNYQQVMMSADFWNVVIAEHVLVIQGDIVMCSGGIDAFLEYDYIGAPWAIPLRKRVNNGNGGFSLRSRRFMHWCTLNFKMEANIPEDVFFSTCTYANGKLANKSHASQFAMEQVYVPRPMALHKLYWQSLKPQAKKTRVTLEKELCEYCPAVKKVPKALVRCP